MKTAKWLGGHAISTLGLVVLLIVAGTVPASAGPVLAPVKVCTISPPAQLDWCSEPWALCLPPTTLFHCRYVLRWVGCRDPETCAELNRQLACGMSNDRHACVGLPGVGQSNWFFLNDQVTFR